MIFIATWYCTAFTELLHSLLLRTALNTIRHYIHMYLYAYHTFPRHSLYCKLYICTVVLVELLHCVLIHILVGTALSIVHLLES